MEEKQNMCIIQIYVFSSRDSSHFVSNIKTLCKSEPQTQVGPAPPAPPVLPSIFLHRLQTSITQSIFKLEHFLRPFL